MSDTNEVWVGYENLDPGIWIRGCHAGDRYCIHPSTLSNRADLTRRRFNEGVRGQEKVFFKRAELDKIADDLRRGPNNTQRWRKMRRSVLGGDGPLAPPNTSEVMPKDRVETLEKVHPDDIDWNTWISQQEAALLYCAAPPQLLALTEGEAVITRAVQMPDGTRTRLYIRQDLRHLADTINRRGANVSKWATARDKVLLITDESTPASVHETTSESVAAPKSAPEPEPVEPIEVQEEKVRTDPTTEPNPIDIDRLPSTPLPAPRAALAWSVNGQVFLTKPEIGRIQVWYVGDQMFDTIEEALDYHKSLSGNTISVDDDGENLMNYVDALFAANADNLPPRLRRLLELEKKEG